MKVSRFLRMTSILLPALTLALNAAEPLSAKSPGDVLLSQEWSRFRGPNGAGACEADGIPATWGEKDYLWKVKLPGTGHSSPVVWDKRVYVTSSNDTDAAQFVSCLNTADGGGVWKRSFPAKVYHKNSLNSFAASTPALDKDHIYLAWASPEEYAVAALDRQTGKDIWRRNLGSFASQHGFAASPIVFEDMLIVPNDQDGASSLVALDCATGKTRWSAPRRSTITAYSTPCIFTRKDGTADLILTSNAHGMSSFDPHAGKLNWELPVLKYRAVGSPIVAGGLIFAACGEGGVGKQMIAVEPPDAARKQPARVAYNIDSKRPYVVTPIACGSLVFLWNDQGIVSCLDAATGKRLWEHRVEGSYYGSPIRVRDRLYAISRDGQVVVIAAANKFKLLGQTELGEPSQSTPAASGGVLFLRTESQLLAVGKH
jgi:outer membrane protein assembly factor BamB